MMAITTFDAERLDACARNLAEMLGRERPLSGVSESVDVIARATRELTTCRHVQAAVTAAAAGCDVEGILRAAGVLGADGKPTPRWAPPVAAPAPPLPKRGRMVPTCEADR